MIDEEVKIIALALIGVMAGIAVYPVLSANRIVEPFSEIGVLGPTGKLGDYPRLVKVGTPINLFIYVGNEEGRAEYYQVQVKLGSQAQIVSDVTPLDTPILAKYDFVLMSGQNVTRPVTLSLLQPGINLRLVFEVHVYDGASGGFVYGQRWVQLWMNATKS